MDKEGVCQKEFPDNSEDLRNAIGPYAKILQLEKNDEKILK